MDLLIGGNKMRLYDFRTEYRENPIGLTAKAPRFSWKMESQEKNTLQTAYEIQNLLKEHLRREFLIIQNLKRR